MRLLWLVGSLALALLIAVLTLQVPSPVGADGAGIDQMQIRVPIDDTTTWKLFYSNHAPDGGQWEPQDRPVFYEYFWRDEQGRFKSDFPSFGFNDNDLASRSAVNAVKFSANGGGCAFRREDFGLAFGNKTAISR